MTKEEMQTIIDMHGFDQILNDFEEIELLEQQNPEYLKAVVAFMDMYDITEE